MGADDNGIKVTLQRTLKDTPSRAEDGSLVSYNFMLAGIVAQLAMRPPRKAAAMLLTSPLGRRALLLFVTITCALMPLSARAASCKTQSQMTAAQRDALANAARTLVGEVQKGDVQALKANTIPEIAADFSGIGASVDTVQPLVAKATITVNSLFALDASTEPAGAPRTDFFCGSPVVVLNFNGLPPGMYALAIVHATGVPKPQFISLVLAESADHRWMLGGFYPKAMLEAGHDGLWYWTSARKYAQKNMNLDAWFYYRTAASFLDPVDFLSSPNLDKLRHEEDQLKPSGLPGAKPLILNSEGSAFQVTSLDTTSELGGYDLELQYTPDSAQAALLRDPPMARKQVTQVMTALLALHPEFQEAFHGIWVHANQGSDSLFSLELPMDQIVPGTPAAKPGSVNP
jgi:hypothetical protein